MRTIRPQFLAVASRRSRVERRAMERSGLRSLLALVASAIYLNAFPSATITYGTLVLFHVAVGILLSPSLLLCLFRCLRVAEPLAPWCWWFLDGGAHLRLSL